jgi:hypothetical protein
VLDVARRAKARIREVREDMETKEERRRRIIMVEMINLALE